MHDGCMLMSNYKPNNNTTKFNSRPLVTLKTYQVNVILRHNVRTVAFLLLYFKQNYVIYI